MVLITCPKCDSLSGYSIPQNYQGAIVCTHCNAELIIHLQNGLQIESPIIKEDAIMNKLREFESAPKEINSDFLEAQRCFKVNAYKATVVMCRRTLEQVTKHQKAKGKTLFDKIETLHKNGIISKPVYELVTQIRQLGNYGAHATDDLLGDVTEEEAKIVLDVTEHLVDHTFEIPQKIKKLKAKGKGS